MHLLYAAYTKRISGINACCERRKKGQGWEVGDGKKYKHRRTDLGYTQVGLPEKGYRAIWSDGSCLRIDFSTRGYPSLIYSR